MLAAGWRFMDLKDRFKIVFRKEYQVLKVREFFQ